MDNEVLKTERIFIGLGDAGAPGIYSFTRVLRKQGYNIDFFGFPGKEWLQIKYDREINVSTNKIIRKIQLFFYLFWLVFNYDIFHFNASRYIFYYKIDYFILKLFKKKIINTFRGSDVFDVEASIKSDGKNSPYFNLYKKNGPGRYRKLVSIKNFIIPKSDRVVVIGPWLVSSVSKYDAIIPYSRDVEKIRKGIVFYKPNKRFRIIHAPTDQQVKGTKFIIEAVNSLRRKGYPVELILTDKISREKLLEEISKVDLVIDQLLIGWYGGFAVEAMALEKPVICFIEEGYKKLC